MFGKGVTLFKLLGFEVKANWSWLIIAALITWSLAVGFFPAFYPGYTNVTYWWMGVIGAIGLFAGIILHELAHSLVARRYGMPMHGITLWIFGGVAEMSTEPPGPMAELYMAVAGPLTSIGLGVLFLGIHQLIGGVAAGSPIEGIVFYLGFINVLLAAFNLIPAFPLDGGRVLRAALWHWKQNVRWATRIAASIGTGFAFALMILGVISFFTANFISGVWWFLIGMFLRSASQNAYQQLLIRKALEGESVARFMKRDPIVVDSSTSLGQLVEDYIYRHHFKMYPVLDSN
jgi:Zn-dependent protease